MITLRFRRHDRLPALQYTVVDEAGCAVDLTSFVSARLLLRKRDAATLKVNAVAELVTPKTSGVLRYAWAAADVDTAGVFFAEFELTDGTGLKQTFPTDGQIRVELLEDLDNA